MVSPFPDGNWNSPQVICAEVKEVPFNLNALRMHADQYLLLGFSNDDLNLKEMRDGLVAHSQCE